MENQHVDIDIFGTVLVVLIIHGSSGFPASNEVNKIGGSKAMGMIPGMWTMDIQALAALQLDYLNCVFF